MCSASSATCSTTSSATRRSSTRSATPTSSTATAAELEKVADEFILEFQGGKGQAINKPGHEEVAAAHEEDVNQEKIVKGRRG